MCGSAWGGPSRPSALGPGRLGKARQPGQTLTHSPSFPCPCPIGGSGQLGVGGLQLILAPRASPNCPVIFISRSQSRKLRMWEAASQQASWICALSPVGHTCGSCTPLCPCPFVLPSPRGLSPPCALCWGGPVLEKGRERLNSLLLSVPCPPPPAARLVPPLHPPPCLVRALLGGSGRSTEVERPSPEHSWEGWTQVSPSPLGRCLHLEV